MAPERWGHARIKTNILFAFRAALAGGAHGCIAVPDGMTVEIDADTDYEPELGDYFRVPSIRHYLLVRADRREVMLYSRGADARPTPTTLTSGEVGLDPPGISIRFEDIYD